VIFEEATYETVESPALALERIDNIERRHSLALGVLSVCDSIADDTLKECLENTTGLLVDHCMMCQYCSITLVK
jgi:hypothetical protein